MTIIDAIKEIEDLDEDVRKNAIGFASALEIMKSIPTPKIFTHGQDSVVFIWEEDAGSKMYFTVTANQMYGLISDDYSILWRSDKIQY